MKPLTFLGSSRDDLREFPRDVRRELGEQLMRVQCGAEPLDSKPIPIVGSGVYEIRVRLEGAWRVMYVTKCKATIYVLHAFQKKTQKTAKGDIELAAKRYKLIGD